MEEKSADKVGRLGHRKPLLQAAVAEWGGDSDGTERVLYPGGKLRRGCWLSERARGGGDGGGGAGIGRCWKLEDAPAAGETGTGEVQQKGCIQGKVGKKRKKER